MCGFGEECVVPCPGRSFSASEPSARRALDEEDRLSLGHRWRSSFQLYYRFVYIPGIHIYIYIRPIMNARASATRTWSPALCPRGGHCLHMSLPSGRVVEYRRRVALAGSLPQCAYQGSFMYYRCHIVDPAGDAALLAGRRGIPEAMRRRPRHGPVGGEVALRGGFRGPRPICRGN